MSSARILVVDDSLTIRRALELILKPLGYELDFAADGAQALERATAFTPNLILLDYVLPDMRAPDVCAAPFARSPVPGARRATRPRGSSMRCGRPSSISRKHSGLPLASRSRVGIGGVRASETERMPRQASMRRPTGPFGVRSPR